MPTTFAWQNSQQPARGHSTWDHYIGKAEHPEFAVYAPNLVPSCGECNNRKKRWINGGVREYLHFYYDNVDMHGILIQATIGFEADGVPRAIFELAYDPRRTRNVIKRIFARHFDRLGLADRLRESSFQILKKDAWLYVVFVAGEATLTLTRSDPKSSYMLQYSGTKLGTLKYDSATGDFSITAPSSTAWFQGTLMGMVAATG